MAASSQKKSWWFYSRDPQSGRFPAFSPLEIRQFANSVHGNTSPPPPLQPQRTRYMWVQKLHGAKKAHGGHNSLAQTIKTRRSSAKSEEKLGFFFCFLTRLGIQRYLRMGPRPAALCPTDFGRAAKLMPSRWEERSQMGRKFLLTFLPLVEW